MGITVTLSATITTTLPTGLARDRVAVTSWGLTRRVHRGARANGTCPPSYRTHALLHTEVFNANNNIRTLRCLSASSLLNTVPVITTSCFLVVNYVSLNLFYLSMSECRRVRGLNLVVACQSIGAGRTCGVPRSKSAASNGHTHVASDLVFGLGGRKSGAIPRQRQRQRKAPGRVITSSIRPACRRERVPLARCGPETNSRERTKKKNNNKQINKQQ